MSHESTLRAVYAALNAKDSAALKDVLTEDAVFHLLENPIIPARNLTGREEILAFMDEHLETLDMQQEIAQISSIGDFATVYVTSHSRSDDGSVVTVHWADLFLFDGERIRSHVGLSS